MAETYLLATRCPVYRRHDSHLGSRTELENLSGEYEAAVEVAKRVVRSSPDYPLAYRWLAAALGQLGRAAEAKEALENAIAIAPASFDM